MVFLYISSVTVQGLVRNVTVAGSIADSGRNRVWCGESGASVLDCGQPSAALRRWCCGGKAAEGCRSPKPRGTFQARRQNMATVLLKPLYSVIFF
jgi:hypothetical protein